MRNFCFKVQQDAALKLLFLKYMSLLGNSKVSKRQRARFERLVKPHLSTCAECQGAMESMAGLQQRITGERGVPVGPEPPDDLPPTDAHRCRLNPGCPGPRLSLPLGGHDDSIDLGEQVA